MSTFFVLACVLLAAYTLDQCDASYGYGYGLGGYGLGLGYRYPFFGGFGYNPFFGGYGGLGFGLPLFGKRK